MRSFCRRDQSTGPLPSISEGFNELPNDEKLAKEYWLSINKSLDCLRNGITTFERLNDVTNLSLVCSNLGRLYRLQAHISLKESNMIMKFPICAEFYALASSHYQKALTLLESKKRNPTLWDVITWELSSASYQFAKLYFEANPEETDRETREKIIAYLQAALKNCDLDVHGARYEEFLQRTSDIHFMLGFSHVMLLPSCVKGEKKWKSYVYLAFFHFGKSLASGRFYDLFNVAIFEVEFLLSLIDDKKTSLNTKLKYLANLAEMMAQCVRGLQLEAEEERDGSPVVVEDERVVPVLLRFEEKLKAFLMALIKCINSSAIKSKEAKLAPVKKMFSYLLRNANASLSARELSAVLLESFQRVHQDLISADFGN